jgi:Tripartite tricarboxylate transporter family receptor
MQRRRRLGSDGTHDPGRHPEAQSDEGADGRVAKGGASSAEALMYMKSSEGDPNKVLIAYSLIYMLPLSAKIPFDWRELSPVAVIAMDQFVLWDNTTLPYKNVKEFIDAAKTANPVLRWAAPAPSARTTSSPSSSRRRPAPSSLICHTSRAAKRRRNWSATTPRPT